MLNLDIISRFKLKLLTKQALQNSCELLRQRKELHTSSWNYMRGQEIAWKLMHLHASLPNCMQAYVTACKLI